MAGRWMMASIQTPFAVMPALVYLFAGLSPSAVSIGTLVAFTTLQTRLFFPIQSLLNVGVDIQTSTALFDRVFEYLDLDVEIHPGTRTLEAVRGEVSFDDVWFRYEPRAPERPAGPCGTSICMSRPARARRSSARPARARRRSATSRRGSTTRRAGRCGSTAPTCAT